MCRTDFSDSAMTPPRRRTLTGLLVLVTGCGGIGLSSVAVGTSADGQDAGAAFEASIVPDDGEGGDAGSTSPVVADAATGSIRTSRLCNVMTVGCDPDEMACLYALSRVGGPECTLATICEDASFAHYPAACRVANFSPHCSTEIGPGADGS